MLLKTCEPENIPGARYSPRAGDFSLCNYLKTESGVGHRFLLA